MNNIQYTVVLVHSTNHALKVERVLEQSDIPCKLIPVPRQIGSDCGVCIRILRADKKRVLQAVEAAAVETLGYYDI